MSSFEARVAIMSVPFMLPLLAVIRVLGAQGAVVADARSWCARYDRWGIPMPRSELSRLSFLLLVRPEFRALTLFRVRSTGAAGWVASKVLSWLYRGPAALFIDCPNVGTGLYLEHTFSTVVNADRIGVDCWVNQQVTIGFGADRGRPSLGNRVKVHAGAIVIGGIHIGDDAVIGAGAVVTRDVPPGHVATGPAAVSRPSRRHEPTSEDGGRG